MNALTRRLRAEDLLNDPAFRAAVIEAVTITLNDPSHPNGSLQLGIRSIVQRELEDAGLR